ncbi:MAG: 50S ribosomal protein L21 [Nitrospirae bacterium]|nr:50S ribosomal protein L21 [Nitrospirota bacterium]
MYAVIETGGKQYKVSEGEVLKVEKLSATGSFDFDKVLMVSDGTKAAFGSPFLSSAKVTAEVIGDGKAKKILVYKQKPRKGYRKLRGHRQTYTQVKIKSIALS